MLHVRFERRTQKAAVTQFCNCFPCRAVTLPVNFLGTVIRQRPLAWFAGYVHFSEEGVVLLCVCSQRTSAPSLSRQAVAVMTFFSEAGVAIAVGEGGRTAENNSATRNEILLHCRTWWEHGIYCVIVLSYVFLFFFTFKSQWRIVSCQVTLYLKPLLPTH